MEGSLSEVGNPPPHNLDTLHGTVSGYTHTHLLSNSINDNSEIFPSRCFQAQIKDTPIGFHWIIPIGQRKTQSVCEVGQQVWRLIPIILQVFWNTIKTEEVNVWHD